MTPEPAQFYSCGRKSTFFVWAQTIQLTFGIEQLQESRNKAQNKANTMQHFSSFYRLQPGAYLQGARIYFIQLSCIIWGSNGDTVK